MTNRIAFLILGAALIVVALGGFFYFQHSQTQKAEIRRLEAIAEQERQKARAAEEARREQEERRRAALEEQALLEKERQAELERQKRLQEQRRLEEERARKAAEEAEQRRLAEERRREAERLRQLEQQQAARQRAIQEQQARTTRLSFRIDPKRSKEIAIAQVYEGDQITIRVSRSGGVDETLFVGAIPMQVFQYLQDPTRSRSSNRYWAKGPYGSPTLVTMPIKDSDNFEISDRINSLHPNGRYLRVGNKDGNILYIGTGLSNESFITKMLGTREGHFDVSLTIETKNKWGIKPRSFM